MFSLFDCHCDTLTKAMEYKADLRKNNMHIDFERLAKFDKAVQIFAIWLEESYLDEAYANTMKAIDFFEKSIEANSDIAEQCKSADELEGKKIKAIVSIEGGEAVEGDMDKLFAFYERGVRLMTLTWNGSNAIGHGALSGCTEGLSNFGRDCVRQMNGLNMLVDVSHLNEKGFWDVCKVTDKPFIATHSNAMAICSHPRNLNDKQLAAMAERGCAVGVNIYPPFVSEDGADIDKILRHIDYLVQKLGENSVGLGCDFDGISETPQRLDDLSCLYLLYEACLKSFGIDFTDKLFYHNMLTFFKNELK